MKLSLQGVKYMDKVPYWQMIKEAVESLGGQASYYTAPTCQDYFFIIHLPIPSLTHS